MKKSSVILLIACFLSLFSYAMDDFDGAPPVIPNDVLVVIVKQLPITELPVSLVNKQWHACAKIAFHEFYQFLDGYTKIKDSLKPDSLTEEQALEYIRTLRNLFAAISAPKEHKALLAEFFESKKSIPSLLLSPPKESANYSSSQKRLVKKKFLMLVMMRLHREQGYDRWYAGGKEDLDENGDSTEMLVPTAEDFIINYDADPLLKLLKPTSWLALVAAHTTMDPNDIYLKALCDRGTLEGINTYKAPQKIAQVVVERCQQNISSLIKTLGQPVILSYMSTYLFDKKDYPNALLCYDKSLEIKQDGWTATYYAHGAILASRNDPTKAAANFKKALEIGIEQLSQRDLAVAAFAFTETQDTKNALLCFEKAREEQPHGWAAVFYFRAGDIYFKDRNYQKAADWYKAAMATDHLDAKCAASITNALLAFYYTHNFQHVIQCYQHLLAQGSAFNALHYMAGYSYARKGDYQAAAAAFQQWIDEHITLKKPAPAGFDYEMIHEVFIRTGAEQKYLDWTWQAIQQFRF